MSHTLRDQLCIQQNMKSIKRMEHDLKPRKTHYDAQMRLRMIYAIEHGIHVDDVAEIFGVSRRVLYEWKTKYEQRGLEGLEEAPRTGRPSFLSDKKIKRCMDNIQKPGKIPNAKKLREEIHKSHGIKYSKSGIRRILAKNGHTFKKIMPVHVRAATNEEADIWRKKNLPKIRKLQKQGYKLVALDEASVEIDSESRYGYCKRGTRLYATYTGTKQKVPIIGAMVED